jgi:hypothetical protein
MPGTVPIPLSTLPTGARTFGPAAVADTDTGFTLTVDRTVPGGLTATPAARISLAVEQSDDGGATWYPIAAAGIDGGAVPDKTGGTATSSRVFSTWSPGASRQARAVITVTGAAVAVAGSLVTS